MANAWDLAQSNEQLCISSLKKTEDSQTKEIIALRLAKEQLDIEVRTNINDA